MTTEDSAQRIVEFQARMTEELDFCNELFDYATIRILAAKYCYYVLNKHVWDDAQYDGEEKSWYVMGRALGLLKEDETSPCVGFNADHPHAAAGMVQALKWKRKG
jgi:hypothetical protein